MWHFRGSPHYLGAIARRLDIEPRYVKECGDIKQLFRISTLLAQLCERYHRARKENGMPVLFFTEQQQVVGALRQAEHEVNKLTAAAAAAAEMLDEAWAAFGCNAPDRHYAVTSDHDEPAPFTLPLGNGAAVANGGTLTPAKPGKAKETHVVH